MRALLKEQGIWAPLSGRPSNLEASVLEQQEEKAHSLILLSLSNEVLYKVAEEQTVVGLWLKLEKLYMTKSICNKLLLKKRLFGLRMKEGASLKEHLDELNSILMELRDIDVKMEDEDVAMILLASLPPSFENFVSSLTVGKDCIILEEVKSSLFSRELRHKASGNDDESASRLTASQKDKQKKKFKKGKIDPRDICNYCKESDHWKKDYPKKRNKNSSAAIVQDDSLDESLVLATDSHQQRHSEQWILDSGCSFHMCPHKEWLDDYEEKAGGNVLMGNDAPCKTIGIGSVKIKMHDDVVRTLTNVRHVPDLKKNLISVGALDAKGFICSVEGRVMQVKKGEVCSNAGNEAR